ncbi:dynamin family protein [Niallia sp.]|uniref:dynamin family protein n=1 Tax=Niallia sp. TaxID=2837523 RepID=UPI002897A701|nr:dynamin family protein [Niallia sp.]
MLSTNPDTLHKWTAFYQYFLANDDQQSAQRLKELIKKGISQEFILTFCGHYSAGKSSMINKLVGTQILPTSPIPTTANIIRVKKGNKQIKISYSSNQADVYKNVLDIKRILQATERLEDIKQLEVQLDTLLLSDNTILMDTPGIDSTDHAHQLATESSVHLADIIFYVVDYNHVQSEINFNFTKQLVDSGKKFVLIVNQMDKHREEEISFQNFKHSVSDSFLSYGIKPEKIFFTTLIETNSFYHGLVELQKYISGKIEEKNSIFPISMEESFQKLYKDHISFIHSRNTERMAPLEEKLADLTEDMYHSIELNLKKVTKSIDSMEDKEKEIVGSLENEWHSIIKNGYIMPFQLRELAKAYLETEQKNFKIGLFGSISKTQKVREDRLFTFYQELEKLVQIQLITPLSQFFEKQGKVDYFPIIKNLKSIVDPDKLKGLVNKDAQLSENYVLVYCDMVENDVKQSFRKEIAQLFSEWQEERQQQLHKKKEKLVKEQEEWQVYLDIKLTKEKLLSQWREWQEQLEQLVIAPPGDSKVLQNLIDSEKEEITYQSLSIEKTKELEKKKEKELDRKSVEKYEFNIEMVLKQLNFLSSHLQNVKGFTHLAKNLLTKASNIANRTYTICLFGAFSAGKSSFANALLDYPILPVSPNPTTATINRILPIDEEHPHQTVIVKWKTEAEILTELNDYLQLVKEEASSLEAAQKLIKKLVANPMERYANEFRYLQAFIKGLPIHQNRLGSEINISMEELSNYVAVEETSCFVASIDVYFDCMITRKGITLVDTPGGDSINSRHTELSFEFMKKADCIFYVSYYNHAFSKADRAFLLQLGRLKEAFEKDKIFFVINAIDLAKDEEEQAAVQEYLQEQLQLYGIRAPRILPVSSLYYKHKIYGKWMKKAEEQMYDFIENEWLSMMLQSAKKDYEGTLQLLEKLIESANGKKEESEQELLRMEEEKRNILSGMQTKSFNDILAKFKMEVEEQLFYLKQRVMFRLNELLKEAYHPSILRGVNKKSEMSLATVSFLIQLNFEFEQELRAVNVRLDQIFYKQRKEGYYEVQNFIQSVNGEIRLQEEIANEIDSSLTYHAPFKELDAVLNKIGSKYYKNPKSFFENNERKNMGTELENLVDDHANGFVKEQIHSFFSFYEGLFNEYFDTLWSDLMEQVTEYYDGKTALLTEHENIEKLEWILQEAHHIDAVLEKSK